MNRLLFAFCFLLMTSFASGQTAPASVYLLYNSQNMDILDYRMAFSNNATAYYAYTLKPGGTDYYVLYTGAGVYADYLPNGTQNSRDFKLTDEIMTGVNNVSRQFFVLQQQQRGYVVSPVVAITKITKSGNYSLVSAAAYSFILDTDNVTMGREMSTAGSRSSVSLNTFGYRSCKYQYSFRRTGNTAGAETAEFDFIPGIGITSERSGRTAAEMQQNQVSLWGINGMPLDDYISKECGGAPTAGAPTVAPPTGNPAPIGPRLGDPGTGDASVTPTPVNGVVSAISNHQVVNCPKLADPGYHVVQPKETANSIARFYGITTAQLIKWNNLKDANKITICQELRVIAPGTQPKKTLQATKGGVNTAAVSAPKITPPPAAPAVAPQYQPTVATPSATLPDLFGTGGPAPLVYNSPQPTVTVPAASLAAPSAPVTTPASTVAIPGQQGQYYAVQPGEGVYVIAKKFGFTDERFRSMNNLPATGNIPLQVGQLLKVSECDNVQPQTYYTPVPITTGRTGALTQPTVPALTQPNAPAPTYQPVLSSTGAQQGFVPLGGATQPVVTAPEPVKTSIKRDPIGFKDYFVKDSETIKDVARKQKLDAAELGLINGRDQNEVLAPGTRLQIPIY